MISLREAKIVWATVAKIKLVGYTSLQQRINLGKLKIDKW